MSALTFWLFTIFLMVPLASYGDSAGPELVSIVVDKTIVDVSSGSKTVTFTIDATDATGIDWAAGTNKTNVVLGRPTGNTPTGSRANSAYKWALSSEDDPGVFTVDFGESDFNGDWSVNFAQLQDTLGNKSTYFSNSLLDLGLGSETLTVVGGVEADIPTLESITVDKVSVDVSAGAQTVTFTITATDSSGIVWDAGANQTDVVLQGPDSSYRYAISSNESPDVFTVEFDADDPKGAWNIVFAELRDSVGNRGLYTPSLLTAKGLFIDKLFVFDNQTETSSLASIPLDALEPLVVATASEVAIKLVNEGSDVLQNIEFSFTSENMRVSKVSLDGSGALACALTSVNFVTNGSCSYSSLDAGESKSILLSVTPGTAGVAGLTGFSLPERPEMTFANNTFSVEYNVVADETAPVISLIGDAAVTHALGTDYTDAGATATDNVDGDLTSSITVSGTVTTGTAGDYTITYSVSDAAGNAANQVTRTVRVTEDLQIIELSSADDIIDAGGQQAYEVIYKTEPAAQQTSGLGLSFYYDSSKTELSFELAQGIIAECDAAGLFGSSEGNVQLLGVVSNLDIDDVDSNAATDTRLVIGLISQGGVFPCNFDGEVTLGTLTVAAVNPDYIGHIDLNLQIASSAGFAAVKKLPSLRFLGDTDGDGVRDDLDAFLLDPSETLDTDNDGTGNNADTDDDGDGVLDTADAFALISLGSLTDTDGDGRPNDCDSDCTALGMSADTDDDNDGVLDTADAFSLISLGSLTDTDGDGRPNDCDSDCTALGMSADTDDDNDGVLDTADAFSLISLGSLTDTDGDGRPNDCDSDCTALGMSADTDDDNDGVLDTADAFSLISLGSLTDTDGDGRPNDCDSDCTALGMTCGHG